MDVGKTQVFSIFTKAITMALGIVQSILIIRFLSPAEFGLVGLVLSIGSLVGVSQHLGIVDGAIREIAIRTNIREQAKVFWVSIFVRQAITLPLSLILLFFAPYIANQLYGHPEITNYLYIFAGILILQGFQDVLGATLTGIKDFIGLYSVQIVTAALNIAIFGYLTWEFKMAGFFWAMVITTAIMVVMLFFFVTRTFSSHLSLPTMADVRLYSRAVLRVGAYMYIARILFVFWQRLPLLVLGGVLAADQLGYLNASLTFGSRMTILAMALSEVNLSWMSSLYMRQRELFAKQVTLNLRRVFVLLYLVTIALLFFTPEILRYVIGVQYIPAEPMVYAITIAFFLYAVVDVGTSSIFVPADNPRQRALIYTVLTGVSAASAAILLYGDPSGLHASFTMLSGTIVAFIVMMILAKQRYSISLLTPQLWILLGILGVSAAWLYASDPLLLVRGGLFLALSAHVVWQAYTQNLLPERFLGIWRTASNSSGLVPIICFAGAEYSQPFWTNRQHIMSRLAITTPVLYIEPRVWIVRYFMKYWREPLKILLFFQRIFWYENPKRNVFVMSQWNLLPGSRESSIISTLNHWLNRWCVLLKATLLGFVHGNHVIWLYDTEAAEYLSAFPKATVVYDCVDDHAAQAGVDRNSQRVEQEEDMIMKRADLVTVTSHHLYEMKKNDNPNVQLVLNAGDVKLYQEKAGAHIPDAMKNIPHPIIGTVGALDTYKVDFDLLLSVATALPQYSFVFIGSPIVDRKTDTLKKLSSLANVHMLGSIPHIHVPLYVHQFDICMIPYLSNRYNEASFPLKFWEFMATGKPLIVSGVPELKRYSDLVEFVSSPDEFIAAVNTLSSPHVDMTEKRKQLASEHTWESRVTELERLLKGTLKKKYGSI